MLLIKSVYHALLRSELHYRGDMAMKCHYISKLCKGLSSGTVPQLKLPVVCLCSFVLVLGFFVS